MYNVQIINQLVSFITSLNGIADKDSLSSEVQYKFTLTRDRKVFYCDWFAIRFCQSKFETSSFSNVVLSLSKLRIYDRLPFIVCLVTPYQNYLFLANTTFLSKISHSSQALRIDNIVGSFLGSNIIRTFEGIENTPVNFEFLFSLHENFSFEENLARLVESTNNISPAGKRFSPSPLQLSHLYSSVSRAINFMNSSEYEILNADLAARVHSVESEIAIAAFNENVNLRGRIIEHLITSEDNLRTVLMEHLRTNQPLPPIFTSDDLGDYEKEFDTYLTKTDIKTKILFLSSNPKGYNIDKLLTFLSEEKSVYLIYVITIDQNRKIRTRLCSPFNLQILSTTRITHHCAGRNSRGVTLYSGKSLESVVENFDNSINEQIAQDYIARLLSL